MGVVKPYLRGRQAVESGGHILEFGQRVDPPVKGDVGLEIEAARLVVDEQVVVAEPGGVALAAADRRPEEIVEIRPVPRELRAPSQVVPRHVDVAAFGAGQVVVRRPGRGEGQGREAQRVLEVDAIADPGGVLVALQHRVGVLQHELARRVEGAARRDELLLVHRARRRDLPRLEHGIFRHGFGAQELDRAHVLDGTRFDDGGHEPVPGIAEHDEPSVGERHGTEEARLRVGNGFHVSIRDFVAEDVRHARVIAAAVEVMAVGREHETLRDRLPEAEFAQGLQVPGQQLRGFPHAQELLRTHFAHGGRQEPAIGRYVQVVRHVLVAERVDDLPFLVRIRDAHERGEAIHVAHAPQRTIGPVERDLADARVFEQHAALARLHVHGHEVAQREVVVGEEERAARRIVGEGGDPVEHRALDVGKAADAAIARIHRAHLVDHPGIAERAVERAAGLVVERARGGADGAFGEVSLRGDRELAHFLEVAPLELALEGDPVLPPFLERESEHLQEVVRVVTPAAFVAPQPCQHFLRRLAVGEPGEEAGAIEVRVHADLEVAAHAARDEPERVVERRFVAHHRAKHHLVVATLRAPQPAAHPGFHEDGAALVVPARGREARHREVAVEERLRILRPRGDLAQEEAAPRPVLLRRDIAGRHVDQLVVHERIHALAGGKGLEGARERRDVEDEEVARCGNRRGIAVVRKILQQHRDGLVGSPAEGALLPLERVRERAHRMRHEKPEVVEVDELQVLRIDGRHAERAFLLGVDEGDERQQQAQYSAAHSHTSMGTAAG